MTHIQHPRGALGSFPHSLPWAVLPPKQLELVGKNTHLAWWALLLDDTLEFLRE